MIPFPFLTSFIEKISGTTFRNSLNSKNKEHLTLNASKLLGFYDGIVPPAVEINYKEEGKQLLNRYEIELIWEYNDFWQSLIVSNKKEDLKIETLTRLINVIQNIIIEIIPTINKENLIEIMKKGDSLHMDQIELLKIPPAFTAISEDGVLILQERILTILVDFQNRVISDLEKFTDSIIFGITDKAVARQLEEYKSSTKTWKGNITPKMVIDHFQPFLTGKSKLFDPKELLKLLNNMFSDKPEVVNISGDVPLKDIFQVIFELTRKSVIKFTKEEKADWISKTFTVKDKQLDASKVIHHLR